MSFCAAGRLLGCLALVVQCAAMTAAPGYPNRPVRIVVPAAPGGALDSIARLLSQKVAENRKQNFYVENRPGANWIIGMDAVAKSPPDGYTLLVVASAGLTINPFVFPGMPLDPRRDLVPITATTHTAFVLLLNPAVPATTVPELIAHLRANPGRLNHASNSATTMLASELFKQRAGVDYADVNFRGASQALVATLTGTTQFCFVDLGSGSTAIEGRTLRPLAVTSTARSQFHPEIPTMAEQGLPGYVALSTTLLLAPAQTPADVVSWLNAAFQEALDAPDVQAKMHAMGQGVLGGGAAQVRQTLEIEAEQWARLIKERNIQLAR